MNWNLIIDYCEMICHAVLYTICGVTLGTVMALAFVAYDIGLVRF